MCDQLSTISVRIAKYPSLSFSVCRFFRKIFDHVTLVVNEQLGKGETSVDAVRAATLITTAFPDVVTASIRPSGAGWSNSTYLVNESLLFRFPRHKQAAASLRIEMRLLPVLASEGRLPVPVPGYRFTAPDGALDHPWPFGGYRLLPGVPVADMDPACLCDSFPGAVGEFLTALHTFPVEQAVALGVPGGPPQAWQAYYRQWYADTRPLVWQHLDAAQRTTVAAFIEGFLDDERHFQFTPVLLHHDLSPDHLLADPQSGRLTGVIDFEDAMIGDPCFDLIGVAHLGPELLAHYSGPIDPGFTERMRFYTRLWPLHEIRYGVVSERAEHIERGIERLRRDLKQ